jgi:parvulin-like peptidyl-prolyl isomerase
VTAKLNPEIRSAIAKVNEGDCSEVIRSKEGYVIYRVDTRKTAARVPLEEVKQDIQPRIFMQKYNPELERFVSQLKEDAYIQIFTDTK